MSKTMSLAVAALLGFAVAAAAQAPAEQKPKTSKGAKSKKSLGAPATMKDGMMVDAKGMTLYTFDKDEAGSGKSACAGPCAANWPALKAGADAKTSGDWSVVARDDGSKQWAYKGKPLYRFGKDAKPGDKTGDGFKDVWHVAK